MRFYIASSIKRWSVLAPLLLLFLSCSDSHPPVIVGRGDDPTAPSSPSDPTPPSSPSDPTAPSSPSVERVEVGAPLGQLALQETMQATATLFSAGGQVLTGKLITWSSSNPTVAQSEATGHIKALSPGRAVITAMVDNRSGSLEVEVLNEPTAEIRFGSTVPDSTRKRVAAVSSIFDPEGSEHDMRVRISRNSSEILILATSSSEEPLLVALARPDDVITLDAASTAVATVRLPLSLLHIPESQKEALESEIRQHPDFSSLAQLIDDANARGISYLESDAAMSLVAKIAANVGGQFTSPQSGIASTQASAADSPRVLFSNLRLALEDKAGSTDITVANSSFIPLAVTVMGENNQPLSSETIVEGMNLNLWPPELNAVRKDMAAANGGLWIRAGQNNETKRITTLAICSDVLTVTTTIMGLPFERSEVAALLWEIHTSLLNPQQIVDLMNAPLHESLALTGGILFSARGLIGPKLYELALRKGLAHAGLKFALKWALRGLSRGLFLGVELIPLLTETLPFYADFILYRNVEEQVSLCQNLGGFSTPGGAFAVNIVTYGYWYGQPISCPFTANLNVVQQGNTFSGTVTGNQQVCESARIIFPPPLYMRRGIVDGCRITFDLPPFYYAGRLDSTGFTASSTNIWTPPNYVLSETMQATRLSGFTHNAAFSLAPSASASPGGLEVGLKRDAE